MPAGNIPAAPGTPMPPAPAPSIPPAPTPMEGTATGLTPARPIPGTPSAAAPMPGTATPAAPRPRVPGSPAAPKPERARPPAPMTPTPGRPTPIVLTPAAPVSLGRGEPLGPRAMPTAPSGLRYFPDFSWAAYVSAFFHAAANFSDFWFNRSSIGLGAGGSADAGRPGKASATAWHALAEGPAKIFATVASLTPAPAAMAARPLPAAAHGDMVRAAATADVAAGEPKPTRVATLLALDWLLLALLALLALPPATAVSPVLPPVAVATLARGCCCGVPAFAAILSPPSLKLNFALNAAMEDCMLLLMPSRSTLPQSPQANSGLTRAASEVVTVVWSSSVRLHFAAGSPPVPPLSWLTPR
mmetsp:Transcript_150615/g.419847  ORF Transcript_150615/g.419847 Transcript_150615/m.419847 type:complete len:358 (+) Transcript_150615:239-1312(+)